MLVTEAAIQHPVAIAHGISGAVLVFRHGVLPSTVVRTLGRLLRHAHVPAEPSARYPDS
jgi:hypothetical protein